MLSIFTESVVEDAALWLENLGYTMKHRPKIDPSELCRARGLRRSGPSELSAAVVANNATTQRKSNVQKMHIALKRENYGK